MTSPYNTNKNESLKASKNEKRQDKNRRLDIAAVAYCTSEGTEELCIHGKGSGRFRDQECDGNQESEDRQKITGIKEK